MIMGINLHKLSASIARFRWAPAALLMALTCFAAAPTSAIEHTGASPASFSTDIGEWFPAAVQAGLAIPHRACPGRRSPVLLGDESGFALAWRPANGGKAGVTGGSNYKTYIVQNTQDTDSAHPNGVPGSLRAQVAAAAAAGGGWIIFDPIKGQTIQLDQTLYLPSNITIDGGCQNITITNKITCLNAQGKGSGVCTAQNCDECSDTLFAITKATNVVITNLRFEPDPSKIFAYDTNIDSTTGQPFGVYESGDCITISSRDPSQEVNGIWIAHNTFSNCHDGLIDITQNNYDFSQPTAFKPTQVTIAFNHFVAPHDKDSGFGTGNCETYNPKTNTPTFCNLDPVHHPSTLRPWDPHNGIQVTLHANLYDMTGARHPRTGGVAYVHMVDNIIAYRKAAFKETSNSETTNDAYIYPQTYGTYAGGGSRIYGDNNLYLSAMDNGADYFAVGTSISTLATDDGLGSTNMTKTFVLPAGTPADIMRNPQLTPPPAAVPPAVYAAITPKLNFYGPWSATICLASHVGAGSSFPPVPDPCPAGGY
jgi:pectate lyase